MASSNGEDMNANEVKNETSESGSLNGYSEYEQMPSLQTAFQPTALDYWYGKKYFEEVVARTLFLEAAADPLSPDPQFRFQKQIAMFPYHEAIQSLQAAHVRSFRQFQLSVGVDKYKAFLGLAGKTIFLGTDEDQVRLRKTIEKYTGLEPVNLAPLSVQQAAPPGPGSTIPFPSRLPPPNTDSDVKLSYYTSMLKEKADVRGIPLDYKIERAPYDPESFRAELVIQGQRFEGTGRSKSAAKHQASRDACVYLDSLRESFYPASSVLRSKQMQHNGVTIGRG